MAVITTDNHNIDYNNNNDCDDNDYNKRQR